MREFSTKVHVADKTHLVDIVGTGGDGSHTFNIFHLLDVHRRRRRRQGEQARRAQRLQQERQRRRAGEPGAEHQPVAGSESPGASPKSESASCSRPTTIRR
jgi:hypothetical protein